MAIPSIGLPVDLRDLHRNPLTEFKKWFSLFVKSGEDQPEAMTLATATLRGFPSARVVLYKGVSPAGFRIFTNLDSRKGRELRSNPRAALVFHSKKLNRQIRVEGIVRPMTRSAVAKYFQTRPRMSQLGAWASKQSSAIANRDALIHRLRHYEQLFSGKKVALPDHWGGFLLVPERLEFWIEGEFRLHDRFEYTRTLSKTGKPGPWTRVRLSP
ncbi:MAG: pyridoxamine 5'-phosphate oxidase [Bdellovibrionales bacterium]|nr:pyridoxamine 5'-phosphate oxidase [Bdellovibrionales bacterium]